MGPLRRGNLFRDAADAAVGEVFQALLEGGRFRLERIVSAGQATPAGEWYDQEEDEWVVLLSGSAVLRFEGPGETVELAAAPGREDVRGRADGLVGFALQPMSNDARPAEGSLTVAAKRSRRRLGGGPTRRVGAENTANAPRGRVRRCGMWFRGREIAEKFVAWVESPAPP